MKKSQNIIGLMSGSSLDGLDIVHCGFSGTESSGFTYHINHAKTAPYTMDWRKRLKNADKLCGSDLVKLDFDFGRLSGEMVNAFIEEFNINANEDVVISSHGHTVFHNPEQGYTCQIGKGEAIHAVTSIPVINDFRSLDVALNGQGAPLVPAGDFHLFKGFDAFVNLGGIANISMIKNGSITAFDVCGAMQILNHITDKINLPFDDGGVLARSGQLNQELLNKFNMFSTMVHVKNNSLSNQTIQKFYFPLVDNFELSIRDLLATCVEHIALSVGFLMHENGCQNVMFTGGGSLNSFLIERIRKHTGIKCNVPDEELVCFKEALIFAFLGYCRMFNITNVFKSSTGSMSNSSSGNILGIKT